MYPLEEKIDGDYVELVHFLNSLNKRFLIVSGKDVMEFDAYLTEEFSNTLKLIKSSKTQKELDSNLKLDIINIFNNIYTFNSKKYTLKDIIELYVKNTFMVLSEEKEYKDFIYEG